VLDEATSALDAATETGVIDAIRAASRDKTVVVVAHRPSTLVDCDRIWRVAEGTITDLGKPDDALLRSLASAEEQSAG
jgi:ABC-type multidrug transport system fused ATPase/permease subunit